MLTRKPDLHPNSMMHSEAGEIGNMPSTSPHLAFCLPALQICKNPVKVKAEFSGVFVTFCIELSKNLIFPGFLFRRVLRLCR